MIFARVPVQHRRLLPDRRLSGPTPWVIAILMMLTLLAAAAGVVAQASFRDSVNLFWWTIVGAQHVGYQLTVKGVTLLLFAWDDGREFL